MDAKITRLVETRDLKTTQWSEAAHRGVTPLFYFDPVVDAVMVMIVDHLTPKVVHYIDDTVALLYNPENREVIGFRIEAFQKSFVPKYAQVQDAWRLSDSWSHVRNLGDMVMQVQKQEAIMAKELSKITKPAAAKAGMELPELAYA